MLIPNSKYERGIALYGEELSAAISNTNVDIELVTYKPGSFFSLLKAFFKSKNYDIIHIQHEGRLFGRVDGVYFILGLLLFFFRKKVVTTMHTVHTKETKIYSINPILTTIKRKVFHPLHRQIINIISDKIIVHTEFLKKELINSSNINPSKILVIPHGAKSIHLPSKKESRQKLSLSGNIYLMIGNIGHVKGFDIIVKQAKKIDGTIIIFGSASGPLNHAYLNDLEKYVAKSNIKNVIFKIVNIDEYNGYGSLWWYYFRAADLVLMPYRLMSTSGIFINAMEAKVPVVCSRSEYFEEISRNYNCLKICDNDKDFPEIIKKAMKEHSSLYKGVGDFFKKNRIENLAIKYAELYNTLA